jgi:hypothetical protein
MIQVISKLEACMMQKLLNRHLHHQRLHLKRLHVDVPHLLKWAQNVTVKCKVLVYVMQHVAAVQNFAKNKQVP